MAARIKPKAPPTPVQRPAPMIPVQRAMPFAINHFRESLNAFNSACEVNQNATLVGMFDDIILHYKMQLADRMKLEDGMLQMAVQFNKFQSQYISLKQQHSELKSKYATLEKDAGSRRAISKNHVKVIEDLQTHINELEKDNDEMLEVIQLCREIVVVQSDDVNLPPERKQMLIRACSRSSMRRPRPANLRTVHETFEDDDGGGLDDSSDYSFDATDDNLLSPRKPDTSRNVGSKRKSQDKLLETTVRERPTQPMAKRRPSGGLRRRSAQNESDTAESDSFWNAKTPQKMKLKTTAKSPNFIQHQFEKKTTGFAVIAPKCSKCTKKMAYGNQTLKCKICQIHIHDYCKDGLKLECVCQSITLNTKRTLIEYIANRSVSPKIPHFIYLSVHEIEQRLLEEGIYRINGRKDECQLLKKRFLAGTVTPHHLKSINDTNIICSTIKDFFRNMIMEPLLTYRLLPKFISAFSNNDRNLMKETICELPDENRDTLAFIMMHFRNVVDKSNDNRMTKEALSTSAGPSIVGFVTDTPDANEIQAGSKYQNGIMKMLISVDTAFYQKFLNVDETADSLSTISCVTNNSVDAFGDRVPRMQGALLNSANRTTYMNNKKLFNTQM